MGDEAESSYGKMGGATSNQALNENKSKLTNIVGATFDAVADEIEDKRDNDEYYNNELSDFDMTAVMQIHDSILQEVEEMQDLLATRNPEALEAFVFLLNRLQLVGQHLNRARSQEKLSQTRASEKLRKKLSIKRKYAPISRAILYHRIRMEKKYFQLTKIKKSHHNDYEYEDTGREMEAEENESEREINRTEITGSDSSSSSSLSLPDTQSLLTDSILSLYSSNIRVNEFKQMAQSLGFLLSWKESYRESVIDSRRRNITYEELREQGDWFILFDKSLEMCRFVHGGMKFLDERAFRYHCCDIGLKEDRLYFRDIRQAATVYRTSDWGWEIECDNGQVKLASYDRITGRQGYSGRLLDEIEGNLNDITPPQSVLLDEPLYGVYKV
eukprot:CAMPEP_0182435438 /NCGR_PEP_ID=MMETSP1167-20130531/75723_1 /TAXON_ID=2988 /ORGANISM="Mallomonas Sp, Strain CCMP3275" /LENGTH=385 /DNA_ID=CAMNT_0024626491 /DNA_START=86 /DNA_END=1244 /DNA_ORIENTATION=+